jgi:single-strand DNA-binding protein
MSGINKVILVGHLGKNPDIRYLEGGVSVASFPLATSETFNKDGRKVEGKLRTRSFEDKEGVKKYTTEVVAENFTMLGRKTDFETDFESGKATGKNDSLDSFINTDNEGY